MNDKDLIPAKATQSHEQSDAIVVSFAPEWYDHLLAKQFSIVIRKRVPKSPCYKWLYFHVNSPVGAICARATITNIFTATKKEAVALAKKINLSPAEIVSYLATATSIGCYELGSFQFPAAPISTSNLSMRMMYHPPQSFFILSKRAKDIVDELAGFNSSKTTQTKKKAKSKTKTNM